MTHMKKIIAFATVLTCVLLLTCGNKERQTKPIVYDDRSLIEESQVDTAVAFVMEKLPKSKERSSASASSLSSSSCANKSPKYDNMRGFDPASEDDMPDNGMSRYMENNDDEGWE